MLARTIKAMHAFLAERAASGTQPWARLWHEGYGDAWHEGHGDAWHADTDYIARQQDRRRHALLR